MKIATIIVRVLLGLAFAVFGANILHPFIPMPKTPPPPLAKDFMTALFTSHYMQVVGAVQLLGGLLLLSGRFAALGLLFVGPVIVNILCFHLFLDPSGIPRAIVVSVLGLFLLWRYRANFAGILKA